MLPGGSEVLAVTTFGAARHTGNVCTLDAPPG